MQLGDQAAAELAAALDTGALSRLRFLDLTRNALTDAGVTALAGAIERGPNPNTLTPTPLTQHPNPNTLIITLTS